MISLSQCAGKTYAVVGLGKVGHASLHALLAAGATPYVWDDNPSARAACPQAVASLNDIPWKHLDAMVLSPGVPFTHPVPHPAVVAAQVAGTPILCDVDLLCQHQPDACYYGITGTNGKSTTTALLHHLLQQAGRNAAIGGNFGIPALALPALQSDGTYVLELSSYQLDLVSSLHCQAAIWLNISPDHLDRHGSMEGYIAAKAHIFDLMTAQNIAVIGVDDSYSATMAAQLAARPSAPRVIRLTQQATTTPDTVYYQPGQCTLLDAAGTAHRFYFAESASLRGLHNAQNAAAALAVAFFHTQLPAAVLQAGLLSFGGLAHRMEQVAQTDTLLFINDSKATNVDAAQRALGSFDHIYWLAGGKGKDDDLNLLNPYLPRLVKTYVFGASKQRFADWLQLQQQPYMLVDDMQTAFAHAVADAAASGQPAVILLSPACASFDQWPHFEARGDAFRQLARTYAARLNHAEAAHGH